MTHLLEQVKQGSEEDFPDAARNLHNAMSLVQFLTKQPVFRNWDEVSAPFNQLPSYEAQPTFAVLLF